MFRLILLFTLLPLAELSLLLRIGEWLGAGPTLGLVIGTGVVGAWLARREGLRTWERVRGELAEGRMPGEELLHALLVLIAGVVLVTPGVLTDAVGLLLLVRPVRAAVVKRARKRLAERVQFQSIDFGDGAATRSDTSAPSENRHSEPGSEERPSGRVIEV